MAPPTPAGPPTPASPVPAADPVENLRRLKSLLDNGLISPAEFEAKKAETVTDSKIVALSCGPAQ